MRNFLKLSNLLDLLWSISGEKVLVAAFCPFQKCSQQICQSPNHLEYIYSSQLFWHGQLTYWAGAGTGGLAGPTGTYTLPCRIQGRRSSRMYFRNLKLNLLRGISDAKRQPNVLLKQCISLLQSSCLLQYTFFAPNFYIKNLKLISEKTNGNIFNFFWGPHI